MRPRRRAAHDPAPWTGRRTAALLAIMLSAVAAGVLMALASWRVLSPLLAGRSGVAQGAVGALCALLAAAPAVLLLSPERRRTALNPTLCWLLAAAVCFLWAVPFRRGDIAEAAVFRADAGWYVPASAAVYLGTVVLLLRRLPADASRPILDWLTGGRAGGDGRGP